MKDKINKLKEALLKHNNDYYVLSNPTISDKEYDDLLLKLKKIEDENPNLITSDSPTQKLRINLDNNFVKVEHLIPMLSLDNTYNVEEIQKWDTKTKKALNKTDNIEYVVELKMDGISASIVYEQGKLVYGATRGNGNIGEDITTNLKTIKTIQQKLDNDSSERFEVRGEVYMTKDSFQKMNEKRKLDGKNVFANARNATSGSAKLIDPEKMKERDLSFFVHSVGGMKGIEFKKYSDFIDYCKTNQLPTNTYSITCKSIDKVTKYCLKIQNEVRDNLPYDIDGMVIKVNSFDLRKKLGFTSKFPRWAVSYKFPAQQVTTKLLNVEFGVGRTGVITPVAILEPKECCGVVIGKATLHNFDEIERLDVRVGDTVLLERAGDVIPKIVKVIKENRDGSEIKINILDKCPICNSVISKLKEEDVQYYCTNNMCSAQLKRVVEHFACRKGMDIDTMGESVIEALVDNGKIKSLSDIYSLQIEDFMELPLFKIKKANKLKKAIENSKQKSLDSFIYSLGIKYVGERASKILVENFTSIGELINIKEKDLINISEIGNMMAKSIYQYFNSDDNIKLLNEFKKHGLSMAYIKKEKESNVFEGKKFVITGELKSMKRTEAKNKIVDNGGKVSSSVSKKTDYVLVGENAGSKYNKALELGVKVINEEDFNKLLKV